MGANDDNLPSPPPLDPGPGNDDQIQSPAGGEPTSVDDGLDDSERAIFESMRTGAEPPAPSGDADKPARKPAAKAPAVAAADGEGEGDADADDDDADADGEGDGEGAEDQQQTGEQRRINFKKHKRILQKKDAELEQLKKSLQEKEIQQAKINERLAILDEALRTPPGPKAGEPQADDDPEPPEDDVFATVAWQKRQIARLAKQVGEVTSGVAQTQQATQAEQSFRTYYTQDVSSVRAADPNFDEAYAFLMLSRDRELEAIGYTDEATRHEMIRKDERAIVTKAMDEWRRTGVPTSAAKRLMALAVARGYQPGVLAQQQPGGKAPAANGGAAPAPAGGQKPGGKAPAPAPKPSVSDEVKNLREAREANQSLSDGGGDSVRSLTTETLLKLDDDEFGDLVDSLPRDKLMALAGR